jgi:germination protein M
MRKAENHTYIKVIFGLILVVAVTAAAAFALTKNAEDAGKTLNVYFLNPTTKKIEPESRTIPEGENVAVVKSVLAEFQAGPKSVSLSKTLPNDVTITEVVLPAATTVAEVEFSENYKDMPVNEEIFCRLSLVWTLTELDFIDQVRIYVGDAELLGDNGEPMGLLSRDNVSISQDIPPDTVSTETYKIYFSDDQGLRLAPEERMIEVGSSQTAEKYIVEQIILGPSAPGLVSTVPKETKINDVRTEEGICYVDLTADFVNKFEGGSAAEKMAV